MRQRKIGTLALTAGLCVLAMACGDSESTIEGDGSATPVGEAADGVLFGSRTTYDPWDNDPWNDDPWGNDPWGNDPWGQNDPWGNGPWGNGPWGQNDPWGNDPWGQNDPWGNDPWGNDPWGHDPWGGGLGGYGHQTHRQVQVALGAGLPSGVSTIAWVSEWWGGINGADYHVACPANHVATGMYGRADGFVDQIGLVCAEVLPGGVLGVENLFGPVGGAGGEYFITKCPAGYAVAGFDGRADLVVDQLRLVCDTVVGTTLFYGPMYGGIGGKPVTAISPGRFFLTEIKGRCDDMIDALQSIHRYVVL